MDIAEIQENKVSLTVQTCDLGVGFRKKDELLRHGQLSSKQ